MTGDTPAVPATRPDKLLYPDDGVSKADVTDYYQAVAEVLLPHLANRPLVLRRYPDGIGADGFFQKNASEHFPDWLRIEAAPQRSGGPPVRHVVCDDVACLRYLANQAALELHGWLSTAGRLECPDRLVVDVDPAEASTLTEVRFAVRAAAELFDEVGLVPYVQTTGGRGYHVVAPLDGTAGYDTVLPMARELADLLAAAHPDRMTTEQRKQARGDRIFLDVNRNAYGQTAIAPYSLRARPGAPVATPIDRAEIGRITPNGHNLTSVRRRLADKGDPWRDIDRDARPAEQVGRELRSRR